MKASDRPALATSLVALWALVQTPRIAALPIIRDTLAGRAPDAWLYPGIVDVLVGITAPVIAYLLWRKRGPWIWLVALVWFTLSMLDHAGAFAVALTTAIPQAFLGGGKPTVVTSLVVGAALDAATILALISHPIRTHYVGSIRPGQPAETWVRAGIVALSVWALLQIPRFIALPVIHDVLAGGDSTAWLFPAIGDIIIAAPAPFIAYALWRKTAPWVWLTTLVWLVGSIVDHMDTITAALNTPAPHTFAAMSSSIPPATAPALQGAIDAIFLAFLLLGAVRSHYVNIDPPGAPQAHS